MSIVTSLLFDEIRPASRSANPSDSLERPHLCATHTKQLIHAMEEDIGVYLCVCHGRNIMLETVVAHCA
jgi:hypothetical protein